MTYGSDTNQARFSPDGRKFAVVLKKGNLKTGLNEYRLLIYDAGEVQAGLTRPGRPEPVEMARFDSSSNRPGIADVRWLSDSRSLAFLAENPGETAQVYTVGIGDRAPRRLTNHPTTVLDFDLNGTSDWLIYAALAPLDWSERNARGYAVGLEFIADIAGDGRKTLRNRLALYITQKVSGQKAGGPAKPVSLQPYKVPGRGYGMWLSPTGRWAVALKHVAGAPDDWWTGYRPIVEDSIFKNGNDPAAASFTEPTRRPSCNTS